PGAGAGCTCTRSPQAYLVPEPGRSIRPHSLVQRLRPTIVDGGQPLDVMRASAPGGLHGCLDQCLADAGPSASLLNEQVREQGDLGGVHRAEGPVEAGKPDQPAVLPCPQQEPILAGGQESPEE